MNDNCDDNVNVERSLCCGEVVEFPYGKPDFQGQEVLTRCPHCCCEDGEYVKVGADVSKVLDSLLKRIERLERELGIR